jgi:hypothetical protein
MEGMNEILWRSREGRGRWRVTLQPLEGSPAYTGLRMFSADNPPRELTGAVLDEVRRNLTTLKAQDRKDRRVVLRAIAKDARHDARVRAQARRAAERMRAEPSRRGAPRHHDLAFVAELYEGAMADPLKRDAPIREVADRLGTTRSYASKLVKRARQEGYLPPKEGRR